jgi:molybdopterin/thiamine biosynthesis adenylyltransferase
VGCGALGSNLIDNLARQGLKNLSTIDMDRVEEHNIGTQRFQRCDIGALKVEAMGVLLWNSSEIVLEQSSKKLEKGNAKKLIGKPNLVVDCLDNAEARQIVQDYSRSTGTATIHAGLFENYGEVIWDEKYKVPKDASGDVCDYPLARNIILLTVTVLSEVIVDFIINNTKRSFAITLRDLKISQI